VTSFTIAFPWNKQRKNIKWELENGSLNVPYVLVVFSVDKKCMDYKVEGIRRRGIIIVVMLLFLQWTLPFL